MSSLFTFSSFSVADARGKSFFNSLLSWSMYLKWTSQNLKIQEDSLPQWHIHVISVCTFAKHTCTMFPILQTKFFRTVVISIQAPVYLSLDIALPWVMWWHYKCNSILDDMIWSICFQTGKDSSFLEWQTKYVLCNSEWNFNLITSIKLTFQ